MRALPISKFVILNLFQDLGPSSPTDNGILKPVQNDGFALICLLESQFSTNSPGNIGSLSNRSIAFQRQTGASPCASIHSRTISMPRP